MSRPFSVVLFSCATDEDPWVEMFGYSVKLEKILQSEKSLDRDTCVMKLQVHVHSKKILQINQRQYNSLIETN